MTKLADNCPVKANELAGANIAYFYPEYSIKNSRSLDSDLNHATRVVEFIVGQSFGLVPRATVVVMDPDAFMALSDEDDEDFGNMEVVLIMLLAVIKDIKANQREGKCVLNYAFSLAVNFEGFEDWEREFGEFQTPRPTPCPVSLFCFFCVRLSSLRFVLMLKTLQSPTTPLC